MRLMVKQKGEWKIKWSYYNSIPNYNFNTSIEKLRTFIGKWKMIEGSLKAEPSDTADHFISYNIDIHKVRNGIEAASSAIQKYSANMKVYTQTE